MQACVSVRASRTEPCCIVLLALTLTEFVKGVSLLTSAD